MNTFELKTAFADQAKLVRVVYPDDNSGLAGFLEHLANVVDTNAKVLGSAATPAAMNEVLMNALDFEREWQDPSAIQYATAFVDKLMVTAV